MDLIASDDHFQKDEVNDACKIAAATYSTSALVAKLDVLTRIAHVANLNRPTEKTMVWVVFSRKSGTLV
jgi:hypothetical protein